MYPLNLDRHAGERPLCGALQPSPHADVRPSACSEHSREKKVLFLNFDPLGSV